MPNLFLSPRFALCVRFTNVSAGGNEDEQLQQNPSPCADVHSIELSPTYAAGNVVESIVH